MSDANNLPAPGRVTPGVVPPSDLAAERAVLSSAFLLANSREVIDRAVGVGLLPHHFYAKENRLIWESVLRVESDGLEIGIVEIAADLRDLGRLDQAGGTPYLATLIPEYDLTRVEQHAARLIDLWKQREAIDFQHKMIARMYHPEGVKPQVLLEEVEQKFWDLAHGERVTTYEHVAVIAARTLTEHADAINSGKDILGTSTGFADIDNKTGGYHAGDLIVVAARPGLGKTAFACSSLLLVTAPKTKEGELPDAAYLHSCEMPREQIALRLVCSLAKVEFTKFKLNQLTRSDWDELFAACAQLAQHALFVDDRPAVSIAELRANIRKIKRDIEQGRVQAKKLAIVAVDYLQLMTGLQGQGREREISTLSQGLKNTAKSEGVCMMALSQLNRDVEKRGAQTFGGEKKSKRPQLSDLRESGAIEQDADAVWFLYREKYYNPDANDEAEVAIAKQRNGPTCIVRLVYDAPLTTFRPLQRGYEEFGDFGDDGRYRAPAPSSYGPGLSHYPDEGEDT